MFIKFAIFLTNKAHGPKHFPEYQIFYNLSSIRIDVNITNFFFHSSKVEKKIMHVHYITIMVTSWPGGHETYNLFRLFIG